MAFRWNDTMERMLLIKFLEQNSNIKLDATTALASWPSGLAKPTARGLSDRFNKIKSQIKNQTITNTAGPGGVSSSTSTPNQSVPPTPGFRSTKSNKKVKTKQDIPSDGEDDDIPTNTKVTRQLFPTKKPTTKTTTKGKPPNPRKRKASSASAEESPSASEAETLAHASATSSSNDEAPNQAPILRTLPRRSRTPATYIESDSDSVVKKEKGSGDEDEGSDVNGDGLYDPVAQRINGGHGKRKAGWRERIAAMDGKELDLED